MKNFRDKKVLVVGLGRSGIAAARFLANAGASVSATDIKSENELKGATAELKGLPIEFLLGRHDRASFEKAEFIVLSPGVPTDLPELDAARKRGALVLGELELAARFVNRPIIAVTGTNGKTTTASLIGHLLNAAGKKACVAGNIGTPLIGVVDEANAAQYVALEVSSFQIETAPSLSPWISILLNATPDHLDRHGNLEAYAGCKAQLVRQTRKDGFGIYNAADELVARLVKEAGARLAPFDATGRALGGKFAVPAAWFDGVCLCVMLEGSEPVRYELTGVTLEGAHNRENMLAALLAAQLCGADESDLKRGLGSFKGLPHRMQLVGERGGVKFYDDSKGTNIGATIRAIESFEEPIVLIAGGLAKGVDLAPLAPVAKGRVKLAVLIGEAANELEKILKGSAETIRASSMDEAVKIAAGAARPGDVVLLSPACASFDMFRDYTHRGEMFAEAVKKTVPRR